MFSFLSYPTDSRCFIIGWKQVFRGYKKYSTDSTWSISISYFSEVGDSCFYSLVILGSQIVVVDDFDVLSPTVHFQGEQLFDVDPECEPVAVFGTEPVRPLLPVCQFGLQRVSPVPRDQQHWRLKTQTHNCQQLKFQQH